MRTPRLSRPPRRPASRPPDKKVQRSFAEEPRRCNRPSTHRDRTVIDRYPYDPNFPKGLTDLTGTITHTCTVRPTGPDCSPDATVSANSTQFGPPIGKCHLHTPAHWQYSSMPLLLFDLDNTLLPRDAAFRA